MTSSPLAARGSARPALRAHASSPSTRIPWVATRLGSRRCTRGRTHQARMMEMDTGGWRWKNKKRRRTYQPMDCDEIDGDGERDAVGGVPPVGNRAVRPQVRTTRPLLPHKLHSSSYHQRPPTSISTRTGDAKAKGGRKQHLTGQLGRWKHDAFAEHEKRHHRLEIAGRHCTQITGHGQRVCVCMCVYVWRGEKEGGWNLRLPMHRSEVPRPRARRAGEAPARQAPPCPSGPGPIARCQSPRGYSKDPVQRSTVNNGRKGISACSITGHHLIVSKKDCSKWTPKIC